MRGFVLPSSGTSAKRDHLSLAGRSNPPPRWSANVSAIDMVTSGTTLSHVLEALGSETLTRLDSQTAPVEVSGSRIFDPDDKAEAAREIVLAVNVEPATAAAAIVAAGQAGAAAIGVKGDPASLAPAVEVARSAGVALVAASPAVAWDHLYSLIRNVITTSARDPEAAPVGDLFALANAMASLIGGAVAIEDPNSYLLAYSTLDQPIDDARRQTILGRRNPSSWAQRLQEAGFQQQLLRSTDVISIVDPNGVARSRIATLIKAGDEVLGSIWVVEGDEPLDDRAVAALRDSVPQAAMQLLRHRTFHDATRRERGRTLRLLLEGEVSASDVHAILGIDPAGPCAVAGFRIFVDDDVELSLKRARAIDMITVACEAFRRRVVCTWVGPTIYALFPAMTPASLERVAAMAASICGRATSTLGVDMHAGVSTIGPELASATDLRAEADRVLRALAETDRVSATLDEVRVQTILHSLGDLVRERPDLRLPAVSHLQQYDAEHGKTYIATLRAFVEAGGDISLAARTLQVHPNTIRYRLKRIGEITGLDLESAQDRLVVALELLST
jgi:hypothetical protein